MSERNVRFRRLAEKRVSKALNAIRLIGNLASGNYEHTEAEVTEIVEVLQNGIAEIEARFEQHYKQEDVGFRFGIINKPEPALAPSTVD